MSSYIVQYSGSFCVEAESPEQAKSFALELVPKLPDSVFTEVTEVDDRGIQIPDTEVKRL